MSLWVTFRALIDDLGVVCFGDVGHGNRLLMDIQTNVKCAGLTHG
jgi:hypothetical protein